MKPSRPGTLALIGLALGAVFLWLALRGSDTREILNALRHADLSMVVPFFVSIAVVFWIRAVRWSLLIGPLRQGTTAREVFPAVMIGYACNNVLPPPSSDLVRTFVLGKQLQLPKTAVLTTVLVERVYDL